MSKRLVVAALAALALSFSACDKKQTPTKADAPKKDSPAPKDDHAHGDSIKLGTSDIGGYTVSVSIGEKVKAGEEAHVDIEITGGAGKPKAVRVWIGTEDGAGSMKSLADSGDHGYHAHAEAPNPLPAGARLWVSIDDQKDITYVGGFDLK